jgi:hypothetical protein
MKKPRQPTTNCPQGAPHDVTTKTAQTRSPRPTEIALHAITPLEIMVSRTIGQELEWYFSYAESALHRERVGMVPSYAALLVGDLRKSARRLLESAVLAYAGLRALEGTTQGGG